MKLSDSLLNNSKVSNFLQYVDKGKPLLVLKDKILMSPGIWKSKYYSKEVVLDALDKTNFTDEVCSLFLDHKDNEASKWIGDVKNIKLKGDDVVGDLYVTDIQTSINLKYGAKFGISPRLKIDENFGVIEDFRFENFSVVYDPAVKTAYINNSTTGKVEKIIYGGVKMSEEKVMLKDVLTELQTVNKEEFSEEDIKQLQEILADLSEETDEEKSTEEEPKAEESEEEKEPEAEPEKEEGEAEEESEEEESKEALSEERVKEIIKEVLSEIKEPEKEAEEEPEKEEPEKEEPSKKETLSAELKKRDEKIELLSKKIEKLSKPVRKSFKSSEKSTEDVDEGFMSVLKGGVNL